MKFLMIAPLHYPEQLAQARANTPPGEPDPLFPPNMAHHFWTRALRARGHEVHAFYRSEGVLPLMDKVSKHWIVRGLSQRAPGLNPEYRLRNARLIEAARQLKPDVLLLSGDNEIIYPQTLAQIKAETGATLIYTCGTSPIVFSHANERAAARIYDLVIASDKYHGIQWQELGARRMVNMPIVGIDPDFHRPYDLTEQEKQDYACDVGFVGTLVPDALYSRRVTALEALRDFNLGIWSVHQVPETLRQFARGRALGEQMLRILSASTIAFNNHGDFVLYGGNMRLFELAAVGAFQIADDLPGVREWFTPGENIVTFSDPADLREKVAYYLAHPEERQRSTEAARAHVVAHHTYQHRMDRLLDMVADLRGGQA